MLTFHARGTNELLGTPFARSTLYRIGGNRYTQSARRCPDARASGDGGTDAPGYEPRGDALRSAGCGRPAPDGGPHTLEVAGQPRTYTLSLPRDYDPSQAYPLVLGFHGLGSNGTDAQQAFGLEQAAGSEAILVYPDASTTTRAWGISGPAATADLALFDTLVSTLETSLCVDRARIFAAGHSAGAFFTNTLGCARGRVLRGIAAVAGGGPFVSCDDGKVAALLISAQDDPVVASAQGESSRDHWLRASDCGTETRTAGRASCVTYARCDAENPVQWCLEPTGGHDWPSYAGEAIWDFFDAL